jgi:hypothetical protein
LRKLLWTLLLAVPAEASARQESSPSPLLRPGQVDFRLDVAALGLLTSLEGGAVLGLGVLPLGPGTLAMGSEVRASVCALACWVPRLFQEEATARWEGSLLGRLAYHVPLDNRNYRQVDTYAVLLAGVTESRVSVSAPGYRYEGQGRGPSFGLGVGGHYLPSPRFFIGAEARLRVAWGDHALALTRGAYEFRPEDRRWSRFGVNTVFFVGIRLF